MYKKSFLLCMFLLLGITTYGQQELAVSNLFSDGVVLQQKTASPVWGWGNPGSIVIANGSWGNQCKTTVDSKGKWSLKIKTPKAGGPYKLEINDGKSKIEINDVLIGEVWICSGQSNMDMPLKGWFPKDTIANYKQEIKNANYPKIRMFNVKKAYKITPQKNVEGSWKTCNPENVKNFSAVGYFFGRELLKNLNVPVGLIHTSFGASPAEAWVTKQDVIDLQRFANLEKEIKEVKANVDNYDEWLAGLKIPDFKGDRNLLKFENVTFCDEEYRTFEYNDDHWKTTDLPATWEDIGCDKYDGIVWYRKDFELAEYDQNQPLELRLGKIADADECYLNGKQIGTTYKEGARNQPRVYILPKEILKKGGNTIALRVIDTWGLGGFVSEEKPGIFQNHNEVLALSKTWKYLPSAEYLNWKLTCFDDKGKSSFSNKPYLPFVVEQQAPTALYNAMLIPIIPFKTKGVLWYQGESNTDYPKEYNKLFSRLIKRWRQDWNDNKLPFYFAQIAPLKNYDNQEGKNTAELREAQFLTQKLPNTGMAVLLDLGDKWRIHPGNKQDVGKRLALWALAKDYGKNIPYSGPTYKSVEFNDGKAILSFNHIFNGLTLKGDNKNIFQIAGNDGKFYPAKAKVRRDKLIVWSDKVSNPVTVKYAFTNWVEPTLYNKNGLPASSFRTK